MNHPGKNPNDVWITGFCPQKIDLKKVDLINLYTILMISAKLASPCLLKITVFWPITTSFLPNTSSAFQRTFSFKTNNIRKMSASRNFNIYTCVKDTLKSFDDFKNKQKDVSSNVF